MELHAHKQQAVIILLLRTFQTEADDYTKMMAAGTIASELAGANDELDYLMPYTVEKVSKWKLSNNYQERKFPVVSRLSTTPGYNKLCFGYNELKRLSDMEINEAARQLNMYAAPLHLVVWKRFKTTLRRCRQAFSDMRHIFPTMKKSVLKEVMHGIFGPARTQVEFDSLMNQQK
jgi:hypothetical protein